MDSTDSAILSLGIILLLGGVLLKRKKSLRTARRFWVNPYLSERSNNALIISCVIEITSCRFECLAIILLKITDTEPINQN